MADSPANDPGTQLDLGDPGEGDGMHAQPRRDRDLLSDPITDPALRTSLRTLETAVQGVWAEDADRLVIDFTDHGPSHNARVRRRILRLLECSPQEELSECEAYVLWAALHLHDIGMQADVVAHPDLLKRVSELTGEPAPAIGATAAREYTDQDRQVLRANHHILSQAWAEAELRDRPTSPLGQAVASIPDKLRRHIYDIAGFHSARDIGECATTFKYDGDVHRKRLLAALLRFADEMDIGHDRVNMEVVQQRSLSVDDEAYWWIHHATEVVLGPDGYLHIELEVNPQDQDVQDALAQVVHETFRSKNESVVDVLWLDEVRIRIGPRASIQCGTVDPFPDTVRKWIVDQAGPLYEKPVPPEDSPQRELTQMHHWDDASALSRLLSTAGTVDGERILV